MRTRTFGHAASWLFCFFSPPPQIGKDAERAGLMIRSWLKNNLRKHDLECIPRSATVKPSSSDYKICFWKIIYHLRDDCFKSIGSMYGIFTYIYHKNRPNVGKHTIHGSYRKVACRFSMINPRDTKLKKVRCCKIVKYARVLCPVFLLGFTYC